jgi:hypothetical protein
VAAGDNKNRYVVPNRERGGWDVVKENAKRASAHSGTQTEAAERARRIVENQGSGEVLLQGRDGKFRHGAGSRHGYRASTEDAAR